MSAAKQLQEALINKSVAALAKKFFFMMRPIVLNSILTWRHHSQPGKRPQSP
jgi:hypothetical protein